MLTRINFFLYEMVLIESCRSELTYGCCKNPLIEISRAGDLGSTYSS